uniref:Beta-1,3-glucan recognition protein 2b n=1 Tax=Helicoverpa armigera TaxID=29058 RepID=B7SVL4_HELAM|nr:beta-1,3-glucan recognition protein 2b [Helicoverpa armigera]
MTCLPKLSVLLLFAICGGQVNSQNDPTPKVEALYPKGFRVTLDDDNYQFFGFRGNINKPFDDGINEGEIKKDIVTKSRGKWIYTNRDVTLKIGDTIYYWIFIRQNGQGRMITELEHTVTEFVNPDGTPVKPSGGTQPATQAPNTNTAWVWGPAGNGNQPSNRFDPPGPDCKLSKTMVVGLGNICAETLIFNEEFTKTKLGELTQWESLIQFPDEPDYPFNLYRPDNTITLEDGSLVITPVLTETDTQSLYAVMDLSTSCTGKINSPECRREGVGAQILPPVTTGKISTRHTFSFKYGRVEVRAKLPSGSWIVPEINLEPTDSSYGSTKYASGLMRVAFVRGNLGLAKKLYGGPVLTDSGPFRTALLKEKIGIDNWHKDFHNYTMVWRPDGMELLVDGETYGTISPGGGFSEEARKNSVPHASVWQRGTVMAPLDQMFHLTLGLRVGGVYDFDDGLEGKPWRNTASKAMLNFWKAKDTWFPTWYNGAMKIDYVRVYAL